MAVRAGASKAVGRGAAPGQGATTPREDVAPSLHSEVFLSTIDSLEEISYWLGTFQERLRVAHSSERARVVAVVEQLQARFQVRRAELS